MKQEATSRQAAASAPDLYALREIANRALFGAGTSITEADIWVHGSRAFHDVAGLVSDESPEWVTLIAVECRAATFRAA